MGPDFRIIAAVERNAGSAAISAGPDVSELLTQCAERRTEFASAALFRFGLDTLATGFWIACVAPEEWLLGHGRVHVPSSLPQIIATLPSKACAMLEGVVNSGFVSDPKRTCSQTCSIPQLTETRWSILSELEAETRRERTGRNISVA